MKPNLLYEDLRTPPSSGNVSEIISRLSINDGVDLCRQLYLTVPGVYPFVFNEKSRSNLNKDIGPDSPTSKLLTYLEARPQIILPKNVVIHDCDSSYFLNSTDLMPNKTYLKKIISPLLSANMFSLS